jgi:hypothetical protein
MNRKEFTGITRENGWLYPLTEPVSLQEIEGLLMSEEDSEKLDDHVLLIENQKN